MGLLDAYAAQADTTPTAPLTTVPRTAAERFGAEWDASFAPDRYFTLESSRRDFYQRANDQMHAAGMPPLPLPMDAPTGQELDRHQGNVMAVRKEREQKFIDATRAAAEKNPDQILAENIDQAIGIQGDAARQKAQDYVGTGNGLAAFAEGIVAPTPENIAGFLISPSRILTGASEIGGSFLRGLIKEGAYQAGAAAGLTALAQGADVASRSETGTAPTGGEVAGNIAEAAAGGAVLGGLFHGIHVGSKTLLDHWNGLPAEVRDNAPLQLKDAFHAIEKNALYSGQNRFGFDPMVHEDYQKQVLADVLRGTPVRPLPEDTPTPMTALASILRQQDGGVQISNLPDAMAHLEGLPDSEIETFAHQQKPNSFARVDRIDSQLQDLHGQLADIQAHMPSIADLLDPDTAVRLQQVEQDLQAPALPRRKRADLEAERDMIVQSVDPKDRLPKQAEREQAKKIKALQDQIDKLTPQREEARGTADKAVSDLRRKLGNYAEMVEPKKAAKDVGFKTPEDFAQAVERAEFDRHIRTLRENLQPPTEAPLATAEPSAPGEAVPQIDVEGLMAGKSLKEHREALLKEMEGHEIDAKDAETITGCLAGGEKKE